MRFGVFVGLIYVTQTEHDAVINMYDWKEHTFPDDDQLYLEAEFTREDTTYKVVAAKQNEMGMTAAATLSMKIMAHYRPQYLIMPGIAAGTGEEDENDQLFGDVVLASNVWNYSNGKFVAPEQADIKFGTVGFKPRPTMISTNENLIPYFKEAINSKENENTVHLGSVASGSTVVATREFINKQIHSQFQDTKGLEMEGYGVFYAANNGIEPRPYPIVAKSVCDFADSRKNDQYQKFAAFTSCEFSKLLYEKYLPDREKTEDI